MYHSDLIIRDMQADKFMVLQLEKALLGVKDQVLEQADNIGDGATRLLYYTSCFIDNYQDICAKLKNEDTRFLEGIIKLVRDKSVIHEMIRIYVDLIFKHKTMQQLEYIKRLLIKAGIHISASSLTNQAFVLGITTTICLSVNLNSYFLSVAGKISSYAIMGLSTYGMVQDAVDSAERLRLLGPLYYQALYMQKLEMMYFLVEPFFMKTNAFKVISSSDESIANTLINMVR